MLDRLPLVVWFRSFSPSNPDACAAGLRIGGRPDQPRRDYRDKKEVYEAHGVKEYWNVDPERGKIEVWYLKEDFYQLAGVFADKQFATSVNLPGFKVRVDRLLAPRW